MRKFKNILHLIISFVAGIVYFFPARDLVIVGVTGTDGKTTTSSMLYHFLRADKKRVALISTTGAVIGDEDIDTGFHVTTPSSFKIQKYLSIARKKGIKFVIIEVTSHAIDQHRIFGVGFRYAILTNITPEHLDYHKTFDHYTKTKLDFVARAENSILNIEENSYLKFKNNYKKENIITYGMHEGDYNWDKLFNKKNILKQYSDYNKYNFLAAYACALKLGVRHESILESIKAFEFPEGRLQKVYDDQIRVIVDFAHTPNSLQKLLEFIKNEYNDSKLIHVFGSAGLRDSQKRPQLGKISSQYSDVIILTSEDPRTESIDDIIDQIQEGIDASSISSRPIVYRENDRQNAINKAIDIASKNDLVLITGKGHERSMNINGEELYWNDVEAAQKAINNKYGRS